MLRIPLPEYADGTLYRVQEYGGNTMNTRMRCSFRNTRASPTKSQRIVLLAPRWRICTISVLA